MTIANFMETMETAEFRVHHDAHIVVDGALYRY